MSTEINRIINLIQHSVLGDLDEQERQELDQWIQASEENRKVYEDAINKERLKQGLELMASLDMDQEYEAFRQSIRLTSSLKEPSSPIITEKSFWTTYRGWLAAACVILLLGIGIALYQGWSHKAPPKQAKTDKPAGIPPGKILTRLSWPPDSQIEVDSTTKDGFNISQRGFTIKKQGNSIVYTVDNQSSSGPFTISTPRGGVSYPVVLSDQSTIWLNAESSVNFPAAFTDRERKVIVTGEVFFEIAPASSLKGEKIPFVVEVKDKDVKIEVMGTRFNVNAYPDEPSIKTTLVEGTVKISTAEHDEMLKSGQQAEVNEGRIEVTDVNQTGTDAAKAWKEGNFDFHKADIETILREIGRWYDMEIVIAKKGYPRQFGGQVSRKAKLDEVLEVLRVNNIQTKVKGKKIIVTL